MFNLRLILAAAILNCGIAGAGYYAYGMNAEGAGAATRLTARFAAGFFLAGFAAPGIRTWWTAFPSSAGLLQAFLSAMMVHFACVIAQHTTFAASPLSLGVGNIAVVLAGFSVVLGAGLIATPAAVSARPLVRGVQAAPLYVVWLILLSEYSKYPVRPLCLIAVAVLLALVLRHLRVRGAGSLRSSAASAK